MKICHMNCFGTPEEFYIKYIKELYEQYPDTTLEPVIDHNQADIIAVCNYVGEQTKVDWNSIDKSKVVQYQYEPPATCKTWGEFNDKEQMDKLVKKFFCIDRDGTIPQPYYDVKSQAFRGRPKEQGIRNNKLCYITSLYNTQTGHLVRNEFLEYLQTDEFPYHLFGGVEHTMIQKTIDMYSAYVGPVDNKHLVLDRYKYSLAIENTNEKGWWSEKLHDNIISECLTFYHGCPDLEKYLPPECVIRLPLPDFRKSVEIIEKAIDNNEYEKRLKYIKKAKEKILNELSLIPTLEKIIKGVNK